ncbi:MAG: hypothetical protein H6713_23770 [Myxococcales bacterium]|nr:hypothetical protein [Myxococcales bacterium]
MSCSTRFALLGIAALLLAACRPAGPREPVAAPSPVEPPAPAQPTTPARPEPTAPAQPAPASPDRALHVAELTPGFAGEATRVEARLRWLVTRCTRSVPPSCAGEWQLADARGTRSGVVRLEARDVPLPLRCVPPSAALSPESPCPRGEVLDPDARYLLDGVLEARPEGLVLVLRAAERLDAAAP